MTTTLTDKIAVVTGATRGIGRSTVQALRREGATVVAGARHPDPELAKSDGVHAVTVDLATADGPARLVDYAISELGGIDVLINNVGAFHARTRGFAEVTDADWQETFEINLFSAVRATRAALDTLLERKGVVINVSSVRAREPQPSIVDYAAAKAALTTFSKTLAQELGPRGVRVNTVSPGPTRSSAWLQPGGFGSELAQSAGVDLDDFLADFAENAGLVTGRMTEPDEVAELIVVLASGKLANAHGADFVVDGGLSKAA
jgi:putative oxidoreductase